jgi:DNA-binding transcriptional LysR family regulator
VVSAPPRGSRDLFLGRVQLAWFGRHLIEAGAPLPLVLCVEPCNLRVHALNSVALGGVPWRSVYEGPDLPGVRAAIRAGLGNTCLPANADELWGLRKAPEECFPPVEPVEASLVLAPSVGPHVIEAAHRAARDALRCFPFSYEGSYRMAS